MLEIKHIGYGSLAIQLGDESAIVLGPREIAEISDAQFESEAIQRALRDGSIVVLPAQVEKKPKQKTNPN